MKIKVKFGNFGSIKELLIDDKNTINSWGFETSDSAGFFSLTTKGWRNRIISKKVNMQKNLSNSWFVVKLPYSKWKLNLNESFNGRVIKRTHIIKCLEDSEFNDFVSRFRFKEKYIKWVNIAGRRLKHENSKIYHQYKTKKVILATVFGPKIEVRIVDYKCSERMTPVMYVCDIGNKWILHARLFPKKPDLPQIKINHELYNKAIPQWISNILLKSRKMREFLWYRSEFKTPGFPINAYGLIKCRKGDTLMLKTRVNFK